MANRALSTSQRAGCCAKLGSMPADIQTVTRANASQLVRALRDTTLTLPEASEEYRYQSRDAASRLLSRLVSLDEKTVDDGLTASVPRDLVIVLRPWSRQKLINVLNHLNRGDATTVPPREQSFCLAASYREERSRSREIGAGGQALRSKPLVSCGMATRATVPIGHVELPFGYVRQYSLQLFEPLHVHGSLHRPPPFVSRREPTRLRANCNRPQDVMIASGVAAVLPARDAAKSSRRCGYRPYAT